MTASDHARQRTPTFSLAWKGASTDGERSFAKACLNGEVAPISAISGTPIGRPKSTSSGHLADQGKLCADAPRPVSGARYEGKSHPFARGCDPCPGAGLARDEAEPSRRRIVTYWNNPIRVIAGVCRSRRLDHVRAIRRVAGGKAQEEK
jgi:hypothetical protein